MTPFEARVARAWATLKEHPTLLLDQPHSDRAKARAGYKRRAQTEWLLQHGGATGKTRACRDIENALRRIQEPKLKLSTTPGEGARR